MCDAKKCICVDIYAPARVTLLNFFLHNTRPYAYTWCMEIHTQPQRHYTLPDLLRDAWAARAFIVGGTLVACVCAFIFMSVTPERYRAAMIVSPANPMNGAAASSLLADDNMFALRYLVQRVGVTNSSDFLRFENKYSGASVAQALLADEKIINALSANNGKDDGARTENWTAASLAAYIARRVKLSPVGATSMRRMTYTHADPAFAVYFLERLHSVTDEGIRRTIERGASDRIGYLKRAIAVTQNQEHRRALATLLMEQERLKMLVSIETPYAASVVEPAAHSHKAVFPNAALIYPIFVMVGAFLGFMIAQIFAPMRAATARKAPISASQWFKDDAANITTRRPLTGAGGRADNKYRDVG